MGFEPVEERKRKRETSWLLVENPISPLVSTPTTTQPRETRDRSVRGPKEKPATRTLIVGQKRRTIKSTLGRTLPGRESWQRLFLRWEVYAIHFCRPSPRIVFLELRQRHDNRHRSAINILASSMDGDDLPRHSTISAELFL